MPADKRLSFQTRVANACTKEAVEGVLLDYARRLECLVLPHARSRDVDLHQVKKVRAKVVYCRDVYVVCMLTYLSTLNGFEVT